MNAMKLYRLGNFFYRKRIPFLPIVCNALIRLVHNSVVYSQTEIGTGTVFGYGGVSVVIHKNAAIGEFCTIGPNVTIGGRSKLPAVPRIGSNTYLGAGCKILGDIDIGENCVIGANAVVLKSIPPNSVVAGIPAKIIRSNVDPKDYY